MKYFGIAIGVAILHRLLVVGVALLGFGIGMSAFNGPSHTELVNSLFFLSGILDFPATIIGFLSHFISQHKIPLSDGPLGFAAASFSLPIFWRIICSWLSEFQSHIFSIEEILRKETDDLFRFGSRDCEIQIQP